MGWGRDGRAARPVWTVRALPISCATAGARTTRNGCHRGENPVIDTAFHVSPYRSGKEKLSRFHPADRSRDELSKRASVMSAKLCAVQ